MADPNAILTSDKSAAPPVALLLLCALIATELALGVRALRDNSGWGTALASLTPAPPAASRPSAAPPISAQGPLVVPPMPVFTTPMPAGGNLPATIQFPNPLPPSAGSVTPPVNLQGTANWQPPVKPVIGQPAATPPSNPSTPQKTKATASAAPPSANERPVSTGNSQADELLDVALQSRDLGDNEGALEALNRADLLAPNNERIAREKAMTLKRLGKPEEVKAPATSPPPPPVGGAAATRPAPTSRIELVAEGDASDSIPPPPPPTPESAPPSSAVEALNRSFGGSKSGPGSTASLVAAAPLATVNGALSLGECRIERDPTVTRGERFYLKVPLIAAAGEVIDPDQMLLDVLFYDKVNGERVELTMADKPKFAYDTPGDFKNGKEVLSVLYNLPEFSANEVAQLGRHVFYGYVVKLYYKNRLMGAVVNPPDLSTVGDSSQGKRN